ncbi:MAG: thiol-disulfide oxidoreductase family protein [Flaviaesturariibacter sp.]|nr:thiol-disulfide oxidoreductase family protein [Flaviaesturariibacter sp.]
MEETVIILFDGVCNYCNSMVNFVIRQDKQQRFRFAPLQSEAGKRLVTQYGVDDPNMDSFVLIWKGKAYQKSTAALNVMNLLPWYWKEVQILRIVPSFLRDQIYDFVARNRYKWFGKKESCMIPTPELRDRFLS